MTSKSLFRLTVVPLAVLAFALLLSASSARAGGGEAPTGPSIRPSAPTFALDGAGGILVSLDLTCWDEAVVEQTVVHVNVSLGQGQAGGGAALDATCIDGTQTLTLSVGSVTGHAFHPGPIQGLIELEAQTSKGYGHAAAPIDQLLLPAQAGR